MAKIDPKEHQKSREAEGYDYDNPGDPFPVFDRIDAECKVPLVAVGIEEYRSANKGTHGYLVRFVCPEGQMKGKCVEETFWNTSKALKRLADFAVNVKYPDAFDTDVRGDVWNVVSRDVIEGVIRGEHFRTRDGEDRTAYKVRFFNRFQGKRSKEWNAVCEEASKRFAEYLAWRERHPRPEPGSKSGYGGGGGYDGYSNNDADDDIPF